MGFTIFGDTSLSPFSSSLASSPRDDLRRAACFKFSILSYVYACMCVRASRWIIVNRGIVTTRGEKKDSKGFGEGSCPFRARGRFQSNSSNVYRRSFPPELPFLNLITTAKLDRLYHLRWYQILPRAILRMTMEPVDSRSESGKPGSRGDDRIIAETPGTRNTFRRRITLARICTRVTRVAKRRHKALLASPTNREQATAPGSNAVSANYRTTSIPSSSPG